MNAFLGRMRVACEPSLESDGQISSAKLLTALNTLLSNPSSVRSSPPNLPPTLTRSVLSFLSFNDLLGGCASPLSPTSWFLHQLAR